MLKFLKKRKERKAKERSEDWQKMKKEVFVSRLKRGVPPRRRPLMKVKGNHSVYSVPKMRK